MEKVVAGSRVGERVGLWGQRVGRFFRFYPLGAFGLVICIIMIILGLFGQWIAPYDPNVVDADVRLTGPSSSHWFGTDELGRDVMSRIIRGAAVSLRVSFFAIGIGTCGGYVLGAISGYMGGMFDLLVQRFVDMMMAMPGLLLAMTIVAVLGPGLPQVIMALSFSFFFGPVRVSRGVVLSIKENAYVDAGRVIGASQLRMLVRHIIPNAMAPFLIVASTALGAAVLAEASLSYLGLGVPPPHPSWGRALSGSAAIYAQVAPWTVISPGVAIMLLVLGFNLFGDALRDIWDPRLRGR
ncbi:MAG: ABC transporter permease [Chloroflexota bacterium]